MFKKKAEKGTLPADRPYWLAETDKRCILLMILCGVLIMGMVIFTSAPERYEMTAGAISRYTINASKEVEDTVTTERLRAEAGRAVDPIYKQQEGVTDEVKADLDAILAELMAVHRYAETLEDRENFTGEELEHAKSLVTTISISENQLLTLMRTDGQTLTALFAQIRNAVISEMASSINEGQVTQAINKIITNLGYQTDISSYRLLIRSILQASLKANMVIDQETTQEAVQKAMDAVEPVIYQQGQTIIRSGERVSEAHLQMLKSLGLLRDDDFDWTVYCGALIITILAVVLSLMTLRMLRSHILTEPRRMTVYVIGLALATAFALVAKEAYGLPVAPISFGPMLLTVLLGKNAGIAGAITLSLTLGAMGLGSTTTTTAVTVYMLAGTLISGLVSVRMLNKRPQRIRVFLVSLVAALCNAVVVVAVRLMMSSTTASSLLTSAVQTAAGGVLSGVLVLILQPLLESLFNLATYSKLLELANPNQPLLRRLLLEAPGTYHHAIIVANLAEAAAEAVNANALLCRAAAYFHDVGKLKRPQYFKENQMGDNPHDSIPPEYSARILTSHTHDGAQLAKENHLPPEIQQIILEHHGDTPVMYFYHKAMQLANGTPVDIARFRYSGPKPSTKESAIVMMADTVEAAVRSMPNPTPETIRANIERLVKGKIDDGQLSNAPVSLQDIDRICGAFATVMNGIYHERIEYPKNPSEQTEALPPEPPELAAKRAEATGPIPVVQGAEAGPAPAEEKKA